MTISWLYSSLHGIPNKGSPQKPDGKFITSGSAWNNYPQAVCATRAADFDKSGSGAYFSVVKDSLFDSSKLKAKRRYEITKNCRCYDVSEVFHLTGILDELYRVYEESLTSYDGEL